MRIESSQLRRPERLPHVFRVAVEGIFQTHEDGKSGVWSQCSAFSLTGQSNRRVGDGECDQREFFQEQSRKSCRGEMMMGEIVIGRWSTPVHSALHSAQGPIIEQQ